MYHNPRCSKSRQTLDLLRAHDIDLEVIEYLKDPPTVMALRDLSKKLGRTPQEMVRKKECAELELIIFRPSSISGRLRNIHVS